LIIVGLGLLVLGEVFLVVLIFLGTLVGILWIIENTPRTNDHLSADNLPARLGHYPTIDPAPAIRRLIAVKDYTDAVIHVRVNATLSADQKLTELGQSYGQNLERLANAGQLTEDVEAAFRDFAEASANAVTGLTADFGSSLQLLVKTYDGRYRRRLR
jgi:hypothetical protein